MLNLPQGWEKMDEASRNQSLIVAITSELDKNALAVANLQTLVKPLPDANKTILGQLYAIAGLVANLQQEVSKLKERPAELPKKSILDVFKRK